MKLLLVKYKGDDFIEGFVKDEIDFEKWIEKHNEKRIAEGKVYEFKDEFELIEIGELIL